MSKKTPSQDSNFDWSGDWNDHVIGLSIEAYRKRIEAKKIDDYIFQDYEED